MKKFALFLSIAVGFGPTLILGIFFHFNVVKMSEDRITADVANEVYLAALDFHRFLRERRGNLVEWSNSPQALVAFEFARPEGLAATFGRYARRYEAYDWIIATHISGDFFAGLQEDAQAPPELKSVHFTKQLNERQFFDSGALFLTEPILDNDSKQIGFIVSKIKHETTSLFLDQISKRLAKYNFKQLDVTFEIPEAVKSTAQSERLCSDANLGEFFICLNARKHEIDISALTFNISVLVLAIIMSLITFVLLFKAIGRFINPISKMLLVLEKSSGGEFSKISLNSKMKELVQIEEKFNDVVHKLEAYSKTVKTQATAAAQLKLAKVVAHDIRSPLSALNHLMDRTEPLGDHQRRVMRSAIDRINQIANDLFAKGKVAKEPVSGAIKSRMTMLNFLVIAIIEEKRIEYRLRSDIEIVANLPSKLLFSSITDSDLKRVLSNLVNNSIEALDDGGGAIEIVLTSQGNINKIEVRDSGCGISAHVLAKLNASEAVSYGKEGHLIAGSGIGVHSAHQMLQRFEGSLTYASKEGHGATATISLPTTIPDDLYADRIEISTNKRVMILDDDSSVHCRWAERFQALGVEIDFESFISIAEARNRIAGVDLESFGLLLCDYRLTNEAETGLALIAAICTKIPSILVTTEYDDSDVIKASRELKIKILPKFHIGDVEIVVPTEPFAANIPKYKCVLVDDDSLVHMTWKMAAAEKSVDILCCFSAEDFWSRASTIDKSTPVYVDVSLANGVCGEELAKQIMMSGFLRVFLATGYSADSLEMPTGLSGIVGKDPQI